MPSIPIADGFLAGSLLSLLLPIGLLIAIAIWFVFMLKRVPNGGRGSATVSSSSAPEAAPDGGAIPASPPSSDR